MCLGLPGRVVEIIDDQKHVARVDVSGVLRTISIALLTGDQRPVVGEYLLIHAGLALEKIDEQEALEVQKMLEGFGEPVSWEASAR